MIPNPFNHELQLQVTNCIIHNRIPFESLLKLTAWWAYRFHTIALFGLHNYTLLENIENAERYWSNILTTNPSLLYSSFSY